MTALATTRPRTDRATVVVAYACGPLADAVRSRLGADDEVTLLPAPGAAAMLRRGEPCDVVVVDPYVSVAERASLLTAARSHLRRPVVITLRDADGAVSASVHDRVRRGGPAALARRAVAARVLAAMAP
jgi:hypothetical protein